jgi:uncharacterized protein YjiS (DUF1127 family)
MEGAMPSHAEACKSAAEPFGRVIFAAAAPVMARLRRLATAFRHRHDAAILMGLDDRMLADIGLTRREVRQAFDEPVWRDPTELLVDRVAGRRSPRLVKRRAAPAIVPEVGRARALGGQIHGF